MIVDPVPSMRRIASEVWKPLTLLFIWDCVVTLTYYVLPFRAPSLPLTIFGSALALFLGFRSNSAYERWWEGRTLWGAMINASRSLARATRNFLPDPEARDLKREIVKRQIAYVNALRRKRIRNWPSRASMSPTAFSTAPVAGSTSRGAQAGSTRSSKRRWRRCWWTSPMRKGGWSD